MVGLLSIAMAIVGGWFGRQWTATKPHAAAVQVSPPSPEPAPPSRTTASRPPEPTPTAVSSPPPAVESVRPPRVVTEVAAASPPWPKPARCGEIVQKSSLESLNAEEVTYLKKACR
jgi:hypothetical protein